MSTFDINAYFADRNKALASDTPVDQVRLAEISLGATKQSEILKRADEKMAAIDAAAAAKKERFDASWAGQVSDDPNGYLASLAEAAAFGTVGTARTTAQVVAAPLNVAAATAETALDPKAVEAYNRKVSGNATPEDEALLASVPSILPDVPENASEAVGLATRAFKAVLNPSIITTNVANAVAGRTNAERIQDIEGLRGTSDWVSSTGRAFDSTKANTQADALDESLLSEGALSNLDQLKEVDNLEEVVTEGVPAVAKLLVNAGAAGLDNKEAVLQYMVENIPQLASARLKGGLLATNASYALEYHNKGVQEFKEANDGQLPVGADAEAIAVKAASLAFAEQFGETQILKGLLPKSAVDKVVDVGAKTLGKKATDLLEPLGNIAKAGGSEFVTEGYQTAVEGDLTGEDTTLADVYKGAAIGGLVGTGYASVGREGIKAVAGAASVATQAATASARKKAQAVQEVAAAKNANYTEAVKTGNVEKLMDASSDSYDPVLAINALQDRVADDTLSDEVKAKDQETIAGLVGVLEKRHTLLKTKLANSAPEDQANVKKTLAEQKALFAAATTEKEQATIQGKIDLLESMVVSSKEVPALKKQVEASATALETAKIQIKDQVNSSAEKQDVRAQIDLVDTAVDPAVPEQATKVKEATASLVSRALASPQLFSEEEATRLANSVSSNLTSGQKKMFANMAKVSRLKREYMDLNEVSDDILRSNPATGNVGLEEYQENIAKAFAKGDTAKLNQNIKGLGNFATVHEAKAEALNAAYKEYQSTGKPVYVTPLGQGNFELSFDKPSADTKNVLEVTSALRKTINAVTTEAELLRTASQLARLNSKVYTKTKEVESPAKDEVKAKPQPKSESVGSKQESQGVIETRNKIREQYATFSVEKLEEGIAKKKAQLVKAEEAGSSKKAGLIKGDLGLLESELAKRQTKTVKKTPKPVEEQAPVVEPVPVETYEESDFLLDNDPRNYDEAGFIDEGTYEEGVLYEDIAPEDLVTFSKTKRDPQGELVKLIQGGEATIQDVRNWVNAYADKATASLFNKIMATAPAQSLTKISGQTEVQNKGTKKEYIPLGMYYPEVDGVATLAINVDEWLRQNADPKKRDIPVSEMIEVIIHEVGHAATHKAIDTDPVLRAEIEALQKEVRQWDKKNQSTLTKETSLQLKYALSDPQEFLAVVLARADVREILDGIKNPAGSSVLSRFADSLVKHFRKLLKLNTEEVTALTRAMVLFSTAAGENADLPGDFEADVAIAEATFKTREQLDAERAPATLESFLKQGKEAIATGLETYKGIREGVLSVFDSQEVVDPEDLNAENFFTINPVAQFFKQDSNNGNDGSVRPLIAVKDFFSALVNGDNVFAEDFLVDGITQDQDTFLNHVLSVYADGKDGKTEGWHTTLKSILFKGQRTKYSYQTPLHFFLNDNSVMEENAMTAAVTSALSWLLEAASSPERRTDTEINKSLGREKDQYLPSEVADMLAGLHDTRNRVGQSVGKKFIQSLGIVPKNGATPVNEMSRLESSAGQMIVELMLKRGVVEEVQVNERELRAALPFEGINGDTSDAAFAAYLESIPPKQYFTYLRVVSNPATVTKGSDRSLKEETKLLVTMGGGSAGVLDKLLGMESGSGFPTTTARKYAQQTVNKGFQIVGKAVTRKLSAVANHQFILRKPMLAFAQASGDQSMSFLERILQIADPDPKTMHISRIPSEQARVDGIRGEISKLFSFAKHLENAGGAGTSTPFYLMPDFWKNHRFGYDGNVVNLQTSKVHRFMAGMLKWNSEVEIDSAKDGGKSLNNFKLRVLEGMGYKTDAKPDADHLAEDAWNSFYNDPVIQAALVALQKVSFPAADGVPVFTNVEQEAIAKAVGGNKLHGVEALVALSVYKNAEDTGATSFTTSLSAEIDGKTNGFMLGMWLLGSMTPEMGERGGFFNLGSKFKSFSNWKPGNNDLYQEIGSAIHHQLVKGVPAQFKQAANYVHMALHSLNGDMVDAMGVATKRGRDVVKPPLIAFNYGSGVKALVRDMGDEFVETVLSRIEALAKGGTYKGKTDQEGLELLKQDVNIMMGLKGLSATYVPSADKIAAANKTRWSPASIEEAMSVPFTRAQRASLAQGYQLTIGKATADVFKDRFGDYIDVRGKLVGNTQVSFSIYKKMYEALRSARVQELIEAGKIPSFGEDVKKPRFDLTRDQEKEVRDRLKSIEPRIHTLHSQQEGDIQQGGFLAKIKNRTNDEHSHIGGFVANVNGKGKTVKGQGFSDLLQSPSVSVMAIGVQSTDGYIMIDQMPKFEGVGIHDAIQVAIKDAQAAGKSLNEATFQALLEYSIPEQAHNVLVSSIVGMSSMLKSWPAFAELTGTADILAEITKKLDKETYEAVKEQGGSFIEAYLQQSFNVMRSADEARLTQLAQLGIIDQYSLEEGAYTVTKEQRDEAQRRLEALPTEIDPAVLVAARALEKSINELTKAEKQRANKPVIQEVVEDAGDAVDASEQFDTDFIEAEEVTPSKVFTKTKGLASPPINGLTATPIEVYEALGQEPDPVTSPWLDGRLRDLVSAVVDKVGGPFQSLLQDAQVQASASPADLYKLSETNGLLPFVTDIQSSGFAMGAQQAFAAEMVEMVVGESLTDMTREAEKQLEKLFEEARSSIDKLSLDADPVRSEQMWNFVFNIVPGTGTRHLSRFAALGLTHEGMSTLLGFSTSSVDTEIAKSLFGKLQNWFIKLLNWLNAGMGKAYLGQPADQKLRVIVDRLVEMQVQAIERKNPGKIDQLKEKLEDNLESFNESVREKVAQAGRSRFLQGSENSLLKFAGLTMEQAAEHRLDELLTGLEDFYHRQVSGRAGEAAELWNEIRGTTEKNSWGRLLLLKAKYFEKIRKSLIKDVSTGVLNGFAENGKYLSKEAKKAITNVLLRTDAASLFGPYNLAQIQEFLTDPARLEGAIASREAALTGRFAHYYRNQSLLTAYYLATGKAKGDNLRMNAYSIAMLDGTSRAGKVSEKDGKAIAAELDVLISLRALQLTGPSDKVMVARVMAKEAARTQANGVEFVLMAHKRLIEKSRERLFDGQERLMVKGHVPNVVNPYIEMRTVAAHEVADLVSQGWEDKGLVGADRKSGMPASQHIVVLHRGMKQRLTGTMGLTSLHAMGTSAITGGVSQARRIEQAKQQSVDDLFRAQPKLDPTKDTSSYLVPVTNPDGKTVDYRYLASHETQNLLLERNNNFDLMLGTLSANIYDKQNTKERNDLVVDAMHEDWIAKKKSSSYEYIAFSPKSPDKEVAEAYALLPYSTRLHIEKVWGGQGMMVRRDMYNLHFGYRKYGLAEMFTKSPADRKWFEDVMVFLVETVFMQGPKAALRVRRAEDVWQATVTEIKDFLVVKSGATLFWNVISNLSLLYLYGVSIGDIARHHRTAFKGAMAWNKDDAELRQLKLMRESGYKGDVKDLDHRIAKLEVSMERNPIRGLIEAGLMPSIVEDVDVEDDLFSYKTKLAQKVEKYTDLVPGAVKTGAKFVYMAHDTPLYQVLSQGTQLSDFLARYTLYQHSVSKKRNPLNHTDAVLLASDAFINYDIPSGKGLDYANSMGFVMFTKYYLRVQRVIQQAYVDNPSRALLLLMFDNYFTGVQTIADSSMWVHNGINMAASALDYPEAVTQGLVTGMLGKLFK